MPVNFDRKRWTHAMDSGSGWRSTGCGHLLTGGETVGEPTRKCRKCVAALETATLHKPYEPGSTAR